MMIDGLLRHEEAFCDLCVAKSAGDQAKHLELAKQMMGEALDWRANPKPRPAVRGDILARELNLDSGPELGDLVERLREAAFTGEATTPEEALALARKLRHNPVG